ncbi:MAG: hypothetical protein HYY06_32995 [Deltaproteobacteria bacterium]|nr:hypothetical protein [Deltaproteobacteria bacterium]
MLINEMKIAPHFFVGLGGCGSKIVNEIARKMKARSEEYERYRNLVHFFAVDTDQAELQEADKVDAWIPISQFDKREYVAYAFGQRGAPEDALFAQWWPEFYMPRAVSGAGAGQIRIEARLATWYTLKSFPQYLQALRNAVRKSFDVNERWRDLNRQPMVHVYASLAGGTGSGSFLPIAYLFWKLVREHKNPLVVGTFVLPGVFRGMGLPSNQLDKIMANGYAGLMELEHLQGAEDREGNRIQFHFDPEAKESTFVTHGPFNQVYLIDDVGALQGVISDAKQVYPAIADAAYAQIFSDIVERDRSTADNDERAIAIPDHQSYTKRYGSFGLSALVLPDQDILEFCAHRFAAKALAAAFALPEGRPGRVASEEASDREKRDRSFVSDLGARARLPGDVGAFYRSIHDWVDGSPDAGEGALAAFGRAFDDQAKRFSQALGSIPWIREDWLLDFEKDPESVGRELPRRMEVWRTAAQKAREQVGEMAVALAKELVSRDYEWSIDRFLDRAGGPIHERLFLVRAAEAIRRRQAQANEAFKAAEARLAAVPDRYRRWTEELVASAPESLLEKFRGNDYGKERVPSFMTWYRKDLEEPQQSLVVNEGILRVCDALLEQIEERKDRLARLFADLGAVRGRLDERARDILVHGVRREQGGLASQHVLDVEVYQDFLDPAAGRMWSWIFGERERPSDYNAAELFASIQEAQRGSESKRHMADAVFEKLVALGRDTWQSRIVGRESVKGIDDLGLSIVAGLRDEAHKAIAWSRVKRHFPEGRPDRFEGADRESWERALESVTENEVEDYVSQKLAEAAKKCQPFLQLGEGATEIPAKKYVTVSAVYLDDARFRSMLTSISAFQVAESSLLKSADPKKLVFYWNEMGVTVYTIRSIDEYGNRYEFVKDSELRRGREYRRSEVPYVSSHPRFDEHAAHCEGRKCPDIPLHIDKWWEGAPDEAAVLFPITMRAVREGRAKKAWVEGRRKLAAERARDVEVAERTEVRGFTLAAMFGIIVKKEDGYYWSNPKIEKREDQHLGRFRDVAYDGFKKARDAVRDWAAAEIAARIATLEADRNRARVEEAFRTHLAALETLQMNVGSKEEAILAQERVVAQEELQAVLARI